MITFRPLMSRPELAGPLGLPGDGEPGRGGVRKGGARAHRGGKWGEVACGFTSPSVLSTPPQSFILAGFRGGWQT